MAGNEGIEQELAGMRLARRRRRQPQGPRIQHGVVPGALQLIDTADFPDFFRPAFEYRRVGDAQEGLMIGPADKRGRYVPDLDESVQLTLDRAVVCGQTLAPGVIDFIDEG